jgi:anti-sigma regulatory factor (Ser/Thr protein kinase)
MGEASRSTDARPVPDGAILLLSGEFDRNTLGDLRDELTKCCADTGLADLALSNYVLAINEIATNAVRHGGGDGQARLWRSATDLWCEVIDTGRGIPPHRMDGYERPKPGHIGGWGLWLARHLCDGVDIETGRSGTRVVLRFALPR